MWRGFQPAVIYCSSKSTIVLSSNLTRIFFAGGSAVWKTTRITEPEVRVSQATGIGRTAFIGPSCFAIDLPLSSSHSIGGDWCSEIAFDNASASANVSLPVRSVITCRVPFSVRRTNLFTHAACAREGARTSVSSNSNRDLDIWTSLGAIVRPNEGRRYRIPHCASGARHGPPQRRQHSHEQYRRRGGRNGQQEEELRVRPYGPILPNHRQFAAQRDAEEPRAHQRTAHPLRRYFRHEREAHRADQHFRERDEEVRRDQPPRRDAAGIAAAFCGDKEEERREAGEQHAEEHLRRRAEVAAAAIEELP